MNTNILKAALLGMMMLVIANCERAAPEKTQLSLQLPSYKSETALSCTKCLKAIFVNVDAELLKTVYFSQKMPKMNEPATELTAEVVLEIPSGLARRIQVLAVYLLPDATLELQYGITKVDLMTAEPPPINLSLSNLGIFKPGSIVGRYLTGFDSGPTGEIIMSVRHAASGMDMDIAAGEIINGWFSVFASENFPMSYRLGNGQMLPGFQNVTLDSFVPLTGAIPVDRIARIHAPSTYFRRTAITPWIPVREYHDVIYGFFGADSLTVNHSVCLEYNVSGPVPFNNMSSTSDGLSPLTYDKSDPGASVYGIGGAVSGAGACVGSLATNRFRNYFISINMKQLDALGNDTMKGIGGAFTYGVNTSGDVTKFVSTGGGASTPKTFKFNGLPGLFGAGLFDTFDGAKVYVMSGFAGGGVENIKCNPSWLDQAGFKESTLLTTAPYIYSGSVFFSLPGSASNTVDPTVAYLICPTKLGFLAELGGFFVGPLGTGPN